MRKLLIGLCVILTIGIAAKAADNYAATQGAGKTFRCVEITGSICLPVFVISDSTGQLLGSTTSPVAVQGVGVAQSSVTSGQTIAPIGIATVTTPAGFSGSQTNFPVADVRGSTATFSGNWDPCNRLTRGYEPISINTATTTRIITPVAASRVYICHIFLTSIASQNLNIIEGTGGTCGTGTKGVYGGTTSPNGLQVSANGGFALGNGGQAVAWTQGANVDLCIATSGATSLAGGIVYVQTP